MDVAMMDGMTVGGERWTLVSQMSPRGPGVLLELTVAGRQCWGTGDRSTPLTHGRVTGGSFGTAYGGPDENGLAQWLLKLRQDVRAAVVHLSDGTREDLRVIDDPREAELRWAVLLYPRHLDVHRLDVYDATGAALQDTALT